jgi:hypothetical protein
VSIGLTTAFVLVAGMSSSGLARPAPSRGTTPRSLGPRASSARAIAAFPENLAPGHRDSRFSWTRGTWTRIASRPLGTMPVQTQAARAPRTEGLVLMKTICLAHRGDASATRVCWRKYRPPRDTDRDAKYRLWWVTGSSRARAGHTLTRVVQAVESRRRTHSTVAWAPADTVTIKRCRWVSAALRGPETISSEFHTCPRRHGLADITVTRFAVLWSGKGAKRIGMGRGVMFRIPEQQHTRVRFTTTQHTR